MILYFAENLGDVIFESFNLPVLICEEEKVLVCKGLSKKDFIDKKINENYINKKTNKKEYFLIEDNKEFLIDNKNNFNYVYGFAILSDGFESGYIFILSNEKIEEHILNNIIVLKKFLSNLLKF